MRQIAVSPTMEQGPALKDYYHHHCQSLSEIVAEEIIDLVTPTIKL